MTRKSPSLAVVTALGVVLASLAGMSEAAAQFDVFFGSPERQRAARPRRRPPPAPRRLPVAPRPSGLQPAPTFPLYTPPPEVPLPPPRPHFPDDAPTPAAAQPVPTAGPPQPPAEMQRPAAPEKPAELAKPTPQGKPPEPTKPQLPARPAPDTAPEAPKAPGRQPPVVVQPVPDELPPKGPGTRPPSEPVAPTPKQQIAPQEPAPPRIEPPKAEPPPSAPVGTPPPANPPLPPPKPPELAKPGVAPSGARLGEIPRQPEDDAACIDRLKAHNVTAEATTIGPQPDERCTVVRPVRLIGLTLPDGAKIDFPEHPTIACTTAETFSTYVRDLLAPLAKGSLGSPVAAVWTGPGLECRSRDHIFGAKLSAHGQGLAIDIAQLKLADGRKIEVGDPKGEVGQSFESAARAAACGYFHTVLGPGSDSYHRTHWHFDLIVRGAQGDSKYCK